MPNVADLRSRALAFWRNLGRGRQIMLIAIGLISVLMMVGLMSWAGRTEYAPLFTNLSEEDAAAVVAKLQESKTPYQLTDGGTTIQVPAPVLYDTRLSLASAGLPKGGGVGFEIFNQTNFGMTDFVQKVNYQRALEGELSRTINHLSPVEQSVVHIVIPQPTLYTDNQTDATASVVLKLKPGQQLKENQVRGIAQLVSSSVEGLKPENLTIVDSTGNVLSDTLASSSNGKALSGTQLETQQAVETDLEQTVQGMLDRVLGPGKATVRVQAQLDWDQLESNRETYTPQGTEPQVRSQQTTTETYSDVPGSAGGVPGTVSNLPGYTGVITQITSTQGQYLKQDTTTNYEISKNVDKVTKAPGSVKKLSVAVVIDGQPGDTTQIAEVSKVVSAAAGLDTTRGDVLAVSSIPFNRDAIASDAKALEDQQKWDQYMQIGRLGAMAMGPVLLLLLLFLFTRRGRAKGVRPIKRLPAGRNAAELAAPMAVGAVGEVEQYVAPILPRPDQDPQRRLMKEQVTGLAKAQPEAVASLIKAWHDEDGK